MIYQFNAQEQRIRARWLLATRIFYFTLPILFCCFTMIGAVYRGFGEQGFVNGFFTALAVMGLSMIPSTIGYSILRHCAYKKFGTKWLTFSLCSTLLSGWVVFFPPYYWWFKLSLQLRRMNKVIRASQAWENSLYADSLKSLQAAGNEEELNTVFSSMIQSWPQYEPIISKFYNEKKLELGY
jgi:hypothetical protein